MNRQLTNNSVSFQTQYSLLLSMGDLERFFVRDFISSFAGRTTLAATLTLAPLLFLPFLARLKPRMATDL